jgi:hypothetical protein
VYLPDTRLRSRRAMAKKRRASPPGLTTAFRLGVSRTKRCQSRTKRCQRIPAWADYCVEEMTQDVDVVTHDDVTHDDDDVTHDAVTHDDDDVTHMMKTTAFRRPREHRSTRMCSLTILLLECVLLLEHRSTQLTTRSSRGNAL